MLKIRCALWKPVVLWSVVAVLVSAPTTHLMAQPAAVAEQVGEFRIESKPRLLPDAKEATHAYRYQNFIPPARRIPDGYIDGGRGMKMHADFGRIIKVPK